MDNRVIEILNRINPEPDYETCANLVDGHILDSMSLIVLIAELEDAFDLTIPTVEIVPDNFNSAEKMCRMIARLQNEE